MVSSSFFVASGWRAVFAAPAATFITGVNSDLGIVVDFRPPVRPGIRP